MAKFDFSAHEHEEPIQVRNKRSGFDFSMHENDEPEEQTSFIGALSRGFGRDLQSLYNVGERAVGRPGIDIDFLREKQGDQEYPIAEKLSHLPKYAAEFAVAKKVSPLLRLIPGVSATEQAIKSAKNPFSKKDAMVAQEEANASHAESLSEEKGLKDYLRERYGSQSEPSLKRKLNEAINKKTEIAPHAAEQSESLENLLPGATGASLIPEARAITSNAEREAAEYLLGPNAEHSVTVAEELLPMAESNKAEIGQIYDKIIEDLEGENIALPNPANAKQLTQQLKEVIQQGGLGSKEAIELAKKLETVGKHDIIPAKDFLSGYRSSRQLASRTRHSAYGKEAQEFDRLMQKADEIEKHADAMEELLKQTNFGKKTLEKLSEANRRWSTEVKPLENNSTFAQIMKTGRPSGNILGRLAGNEAGLDVLHSMLSRNPRALRAVIGQSYANNPRNLLSAPTRHQEMANSLPQLQGMMRRIKEALENEKVAEALTEHRKQEASRIEGEFQARKLAQQNREQLLKIEAQIKGLLQDLKRLEQIATRKESTLRQKMEAGMKVEKINKRIDLLKKAAKAIFYAKVGIKII